MTAMGHIRGVRTEKDLLFHPICTIQCYGWRFFFLALWCVVGGKDTTWQSIECQVYKKK